MLKRFFTPLALLATIYSGRTSVETSILPQTTILPTKLKCLSSTKVMARQHTPTQPRQKRPSRRKDTRATGSIVIRSGETSHREQDDQDSSSNDDSPTQVATQQLQTRAKKKRGNKTTKIYKSFKYTKSWVSKKNIAFNCNTRRTSGCTAQLKITPLGEWSVTGSHTCRSNVIVGGALANETDAMKRMTDKLTTENPGMTENEIWGLVCAQFYGEDREELVDGLTEEQVIGRVRRARRRYYGGNIHGVVEVPPFSKVTDSAIPFFRFHFVTAHQNPKKPAERILGWAHPALKELLLYNSISLFVDGTFRCVPRGFHQCIILMVDDLARNMFTPVYFVLCTSRTETTYNDILHLISRDTGKKMTPAEIVCDFEFGLISAVQQAFPNAEVVGCFFHFKQALSRRMKFEHITKKEISIAMTPGCLDILAVIDPEFIDPKGIAWVKLEIKRQCATKGCAYSTRQWRSFWRYFHRIWLGKYSVSEWNVFGIANTIVARTNNPLERFNREMNAAFKPHPSLRHFVATIAKMSSGYARKMSNITRGLRQKKKRLPRIDLPMSPDFDAFEVPAESDIEDEVSSDSDEFIESFYSSSDDDDILDGSSDDDLPSGEVVVESLEPEIEQQAVGYDFSLDYSGSEDSGEETNDI